MARRVAGRADDAVDAAKIIDEFAAPANRMDSSPWSLGWSARGRAIEEHLVGEYRLPHGFPTVDYFRDGVVASVKSIDLGAVTYQDTNRLRSTLNRYLNKLDEFEGGTRGRLIERGDFVQKELWIAIQQGAGNANQMEVFGEIGRAAAERGINIRVYEVP